MKAVLAALLLSTCTPGAAPSPTPDPIGIPDPWDSGAPAEATCASAYSHMFELGCPPAEDAHFGWRDIDCAALPSSAVTCIARATTCQATRECAEKK